MSRPDFEILPSPEELHDLEVHEAIGERDARIERLKALLEQVEAERDDMREDIRRMTTEAHALEDRLAASQAEAADLRDELAEANSRAAYLGDDAAAERSSRLWLARAVKVLAERARSVTTGATDLERLMAASLLAAEVTQLAKASGSLCFEVVGGEVQP